jgi:hypothetical protein
MPNVNKNIYCTLAIGKQHSEYARFLARDLQVYKVPLVIVTNCPEMFKGFKYVHIVEHRPPWFNFHDKRLPLQEALKLGETAVFVDADTCVWFGADRRAVREALAYEFPPGLHATRLFPAGYYDYPHHEAKARSWGFEFDRNVITYWEALFALTRDPNVDKFFACWEKFVEDAKDKGTEGSVGEGTCFGICAEASGIQRHYTTYMVKSSLPFLLWHSRLDANRRKFYHFKYALKEALSGHVNIHHHCWS